MPPASTPTECVACGAGNLKSRETFEKWTLYECSTCDLQFWWPFQNPGHTFYEDDKESVTRNVNPLAMPLYEMQKQFLREKPKRGGTLLDLGMGSGRFLSGARDAGYRVSGCDFDTKAIDTAKNYFKLDDVYALSVEDFVKKFPDKTYDVVTMFEILEHLDGFDAIEEVKKLVKPDGLLVLSTPWRGRWKEFFKGDNPPEHLTRWSDAAIRNFFSARGFKVTRLTHTTGSPDYFSRLLMRFSEWTKGWLSFGLSEKLTEKKPAPCAESGARAPRKASLRNRIIRVLSLVKLYGLFFIPTLVLYGYLWITGGRHANSLYVFMEHSDAPR